MTTIKIGLIGLGIVGSAVVRLIQKTNEMSPDCQFVIQSVAVRNLHKKRDCQLDPTTLLTTDVSQVVNDPEIQVLIEVAGSANIMFPYLINAIQNKKHVITANKALMANHGDYLLAEAKENKVWIGYEASCAGSISIIKPLRENFLINRITRLEGIVNGTTNFILSSMEEKGCSYEEALAMAQEKGFAEADPTEDVEGIDAASKLAILGGLAFGHRIQPKQINRRGITNISAQDIKLFSEHHCRIKLLAIATKTSHGLALSVKPTILPKSMTAATMSGAFNCIEMEDAIKGKSTLVGLGAGGDATATAVLADLIDVWREPSPVAIATQTRGFEPEEEKSLALIDTDKVSQNYYARIRVPANKTTKDILDAINFQVLPKCHLDVISLEEDLSILISHASYSEISDVLSELAIQEVIKGYSVFLVYGHAMELLKQDKLLSQIEKDCSVQAMVKRASQGLAVVSSGASTPSGSAVDQTKTADRSRSNTK